MIGQIDALMHDEMLLEEVVAGPKMRLVCRNDDGMKTRNGMKKIDESAFETGKPQREG